MSRVAPRLLLLAGLALGVSARAWVPREAPPEYVEVVLGDEVRWVQAPDREVDEVLAAIGREPLHAHLTIPAGRALVARGDGWALESATLPQLEGAPVDLNLAGPEALLALPGVGPATARAIREGRPYRDVAEIVRARGVGPATLAQLEGHVFVHDAVPAPRRVDLNCDGERRLQSLPRVGPVIAARIVAARPFAQLDDLERVSGIGPATVARLDGEVVLGDCR